MKIVIFNGSLSTQTFIKRMVGSLATYNITVYVAGFSSRRTPASKSEYHKINLGNKANLILLSIRIIITFLSAFFKNPNKVISHILTLIFLGRNTQQECIARTKTEHSYGLAPPLCQTIDN